MVLSLNQGLVPEVEFVNSPNQDDRPEGVDPEIIVIHSICLPPEVYGGYHIHELFCNHLDPAQHPYFKEIQHLKVSAHFLIRRDGELIQFVNTDKRAWHAGQSCCEGREQVNDFSIGIELEGTDTDLFSNQQYRKLAELIGLLRTEYLLITDQGLHGHSDIAPGRKTDPGTGFDWKYLRSLL